MDPAEVAQVSVIEVFCYRQQKPLVAVIPEFGMGLSRGKSFRGQAPAIAFFEPSRIVAICPATALISPRPSTLESMPFA